MIIVSGYNRNDCYKTLAVCVCVCVFVCAYVCVCARAHVIISIYFIRNVSSAFGCGCDFPSFSFRHLSTELCDDCYAMKRAPLNSPRICVPKPHVRLTLSGLSLIVAV